MKSDVFDSFVKIAQEKGMISNDSEDSKKKLEKTHRADSLDISAIEALYGVKPNTPKDMEYEHNIMEDAHPNSVVILPSYDKLNGLVENENERQNINIHIVMKTPDGLSTQRKYAQELVLSLVRVANDLDNKNQDKLMALADLCLLQASQPLTKTAVAPLVIAGVAAAAALIGGIYLKNHMAFFSDGFEQDYQKLVAEIDDLIESNDSIQTSVGAGYNYRPEFIQEMQNFKNKLAGYYNLYKSIEPYIDQLEKPKDAGELLEAIKKPETNAIVNAYKSFRSATDKILPYFQKIEQDFDNPSYKQRQIVEKGWAMKVVDPFLHGGKGLVADDFDDVAHALKTFMGDMQNINKALKEAKSHEDSLTKDLTEASYKSQEMFGSEEEGGTASTTGKPPTSKEQIDQGAEDLEKQLGEIGLI